MHAHHANEELLLVLAGTPSLRTPDGTQLLSAGAVVAFPRGQTGAHSVVDRSDALAAGIWIEPYLDSNCDKITELSAWLTASSVLLAAEVVL